MTPNEARCSDKIVLLYRAKRIKLIIWLDLAANFRGFGASDCEMTADAPCPEYMSLREQYETALQRWGYVLLSQRAGLVGRDIQSALELRKNAADERDATNKRMEDHKRSCPVCNHNGRPHSVK